MRFGLDGRFSRFLRGGSIDLLMFEQGPRFGEPKTARIFSSVAEEDCVYWPSRVCDAIAR